MGANTTQATGLLVFLVAFILIAVAAAGGGILFLVLGLVALAASCVIFIKAKPLEHMEG